MPITYSLIFNRKNKSNEKKQPINIRCTFERKSKFISTGIKILEKEWNNSTKKVKKNNENFHNLNRSLYQQIEALEYFEEQTTKKEGLFRLEYFNRFLQDKKGASNNFESFCKEQIAKSKHSDGTKRHYKVMLKYFKEFSKERVNLKNIDYEMITDFDAFLFAKKLHANTVAGHHKRIKALLNSALKLDIISKNPYINFKIKTVRTEKTFLTQKEIEKFENLKITNKSVALVRDIFLFSCYAGLRYSDMQNLKKTDIDDDYEMNFIQKKTRNSKEVAITLECKYLFDGKNMPIIDYYKKNNKGKFLFPRISDKEINLKLKVIAISSDITKTLTHHIARHTFGTHLARVFGDPYLIKNMMGHSKLETSLTYIHLSNDIIKTKVKRAKWD